MRSLLKAFLPTFILFSIFARITAVDDLHRNLHDGLTQITLPGLMLYFSYLAPLLYAILFLTQLLIIMPMWNRANNKIKVAIPVSIASLLLSLGISYIIWNSASGINDLFSSIITLFLLQMVYWVLNLFILFLMDKVTYLKHQPHI
ncbi:hypothetical protein [Mucilaginibacter sp.]|jgi:hypothetical protein|uniref:hypothetical protein n=1 Tax=Mucilaginibacter sp. TaxID=1882438 RepID=UPI0035661466